MNSLNNLNGVNACGALTSRKQRKIRIRPERIKTRAHARAIAYVYIRALSRTHPLIPRKGNLINAMQ